MSPYSEDLARYRKYSKISNRFLLAFMIISFVLTFVDQAGALFFVSILLSAMAFFTSIYLGDIVSSLQSAEKGWRAHDLLSKPSTKDSDQTVRKNSETLLTNFDSEPE